MFYALSSLEKTLSFLMLISVIASHWALIGQTAFFLNYIYLLELTHVSVHANSLAFQN